MQDSEKLLVKVGSDFRLRLKEIEEALILFCVQENAGCVNKYTIKFIKWLVKTLHEEIGALDIWIRENNTRLEFGRFESNKGFAIFTLNFQSKQPRFYVAGKNSVKKRLTDMKVEKAKPLSIPYHLEVINGVSTKSSYKSRLPEPEEGTVTFINNLQLKCSDINANPNKQNTSSARDSDAQRKFRKNAFRVYGEKCIITGDAPPCALEAAHIVPHNSLMHDESFHPWNCLVLRRDIHGLYDSGDIIIDSDFKVLVINEKLNEMDSYKCLNGSELNISNINHKALNISESKFIELLKIQLNKHNSDNPSKG